MLLLQRAALQHSLEPIEVRTLALEVWVVNAAVILVKDFRVPNEKAVVEFAARGTGRARFTETAADERGVDVDERDFESTIEQTEGIELRVESANNIIDSRSIAW